MMTIKKIGAVLATILAVVIRLPLTWFACLLNVIDFNLVKLTVNLGRVIDNDLWTEIIDSSLDTNVEGMEIIGEMFENLKEDLA